MARLFSLAHLHHFTFIRIFVCFVFFLFIQCECWKSGEKERQLNFAYLANSLIG